MPLLDEDGLRHKIESVIADWVMPGIPPAVIAQNIIDELGLEVETTIQTYPAPGASDFEGVVVTTDGKGGWSAELDGIDVSTAYKRWTDRLPRRSRIIGPYHEEEQ